MHDVLIRNIEQPDNAAIATIIRRSLEEFEANKPGTVYFDDSTDHLFELFKAAPGSVYLVAIHNNKLVGGAGIYPTQGLPKHTCELVKMYLHKEVRGIGLGGQMINACLSWAKSNGYSEVYLETMPELRKAVTVYEKFGFTYLDAPMGNSGHNGCDIWMKREL